jgi:hypothetical protein
LSGTCNARFPRSTIVIHTDAIKDQIIPPEVTKEQASSIYASEADFLNVALFGKTAAEWRATNPDAKGTSATMLHWSRWSYSPST